MAAKTYDPGKVVVSFAGNLIGGFSDGSFVKADRTSNAFDEKVGAQGEVCRIRNRDQTGTVELTLLGSSSSNDILSAIADADELAGLGQGPLFIKDLNGTTLIAASSAWIKKRPTVEHGKELADRVWLLFCADLDLDVGSNSF